MIAFLLPSTKFPVLIYLQATHLSHTILLFPYIISHALTLEEEFSVFKPVYFIQLNSLFFIMLHLVLSLYLYHVFGTVFGIWGEHI